MYIYRFIIFLFLLIVFNPDVSYGNCLESLGHQSLKKGSQIFVENCKGCHSLKYIRYNTVLKSTKLNDDKLETLMIFLKENWLFLNKNLNNPIINNMAHQNSIKWFGVSPPDLTLIIKYRGNNWVFEYMNSFFKNDNNFFLGSNNFLLNNVNMPHILNWVHGSNEFNILIQDLINFLSFSGDQNKIISKKTGLISIIFLFLFVILLFKLKKDYWREL